MFIILCSGCGCHPPEKVAFSFRAYNTKLHMKIKFVQKFQKNLMDGGERTGLIT